jgi:hypothetical protein
MNVLAIDIGGTHVKILATGQDDRREFESGPKLTPQFMVAKVKSLAKDWKYELVSIGYPGLVRFNRPIAEPRNLGKGWVGFNFEAAFGRPVRIRMMRPCKQWEATGAARCSFWAWERDLAPPWLWKALYFRSSWDTFLTRREP